MTIDAIREYALGFPGVAEDIKWGNNLCFTVGGKIFLIVNPDEFPVSASFKTTAELFEELTAGNLFIPAPYLARNNWLMAENVALVEWSEWKKYIAGSYNLVFHKLSARVRKLNLP